MLAQVETDLLGVNSKMPAEKEEDISAQDHVAVLNRNTGGHLAFKFVGRRSARLSEHFLMKLAFIGQVSRAHPRKRKVNNGIDGDTYSSKGRN